MASTPKKLDQVVAVDLGGRSTKAVLLQRKGDNFHLNRFAILDAPIYEKSLSVELLSDHLKAVYQALDSRVKHVVLGVGSNDSVVRHAEVPMMPISDLRLMLKLNSKNYLQQDLPDYVFDAFAVPPAGGQAPVVQVEKPKPVALQKQRVLVAGAKRNLISDLQAAAKAAGLNPVSIVPATIGPPNVFEAAQPEIFANEIVALVDLGYRSSSIAILEKGDLALNRVVSGGGEKLTLGLAESLGISPVEAESIKVKLMGEVENNIEPLLGPLGRELRASVDFYEHQQDKQVGQVFLSGGSARSEFIVRTLQNSLMVPCQAWNPTSFMQFSLPPQQMGEIEEVNPLLAVVVGMALSVL